jgi:hypothetical protein
MKLTKNLKTMIAAVALAGAAGTVGVAFTSTGMITSGEAANDQFVGGMVSQNVTGGNLSDIVYGFSDGPANTLVNTVTLTFADDNTDGLVPTIDLLGVTEAGWSCAAIVVATNVSACAGAAIVGVTGIEVTVPNANPAP